MAALRAATWSSHQQLEKRLDIKSRFSDLHAYRAHLAQMWGFCAEFEAALAPASFGGALPDYEARRKLPLLTRDLIHLGLTPHSVSRLPRCTRMPPAASPAAAFGCAYVLEGATQGGALLLPLVERQMGLTADLGAAFLASYRADTAAMWLNFSGSLNQWCSRPDRQLAAVQAATATFETLGEWLCRGAA